MERDNVEEDQSYAGRRGLLRAVAGSKPGKVELFLVTGSSKLSNDQFGAGDSGEHSLKTPEEGRTIWKMF